MSGDEDDRDPGLAAVQFLLEFGPAHSRHGDVEDQTLASRDAILCQKLVGGTERLGSQTEHLEEIWQRFPDRLIIVDD